MCALAIARCRKGHWELHTFLAPDLCPVPGDRGILFLPGHCVQYPETRNAADFSAASTLTP